MRTLFEQSIPVAYHMFYIRSGGAGTADPGYGGQRNGLCGAAEPGCLTFVAGLHTGRVPVRVELHDDAPPLDRIWEEVVEVSYTPGSGDVRLALWDGPRFPLALDAGDYRVRFSGVGFDNDNAEVTDPPERYLVQFWPAPPAPDAVLRQTSGTAAYWHRTAQATPPPPTPQARADAARQEQLERDRQEERWRRERQARYWSGRTPTSERLLAIAPYAVGLAKLDRDLVDEIDAAEPHIQRAMAAWAAHRSCERAGLSATDWVAAALTALDRGAPAPPAFADFDAAFARLHDVPRDSVTRHVTVELGGFEPESRPEPRIDPRISALHTVITARDADPLLAALTAVRAAAEVVPAETAATIAAFRSAFSLPR